MMNSLFTCRAVLAVLLLILAGCSTAPPVPSKSPNPFVSQFNESESPDKARVVEMLDDKGVTIGTELLFRPALIAFMKADLIIIRFTLTGSVC